MQKDVDSLPLTGQGTVRLAAAVSVAATLSYILGVATFGLNVGTAVGWSGLLLLVCASAAVWFAKAPPAVFTAAAVGTTPLALFAAAGGGTSPWYRDASWLWVLAAAASALLTVRLLWVSITSGALILLILTALVANPQDVTRSVYGGYLLASAAMGAAITATWAARKRRATVLRRIDDEAAAAVAAADQTTRSDAVFRLSCAVHDTFANTFAAVADGLGVTHPEQVRARAAADLAHVSELSEGLSHSASDSLPGTICELVSDRGNQLGLHVMAVRTGPDPVTPPPQVVNALLGCIFEALLNASKHSSGPVRVHIDSTLAGLHVRITDSGPAPHRPPRPARLLAAAERAGITANVTLDGPGTCIDLGWVSPQAPTPGTAPQPAGLDMAAARAAAMWLAPAAAAAAVLDGQGPPWVIAFGLAGIAAALVARIPPWLVALLAGATWPVGRQTETWATVIFCLVLIRSRTMPGAARVFGAFLAGAVATWLVSRTWLADATSLQPPSLAAIGVCGAVALVLAPAVWVLARAEDRLDAQADRVALLRQVEVVRREATRVSAARASAVVESGRNLLARLADPDVDPGSAAIIVEAEQARDTARMMLRADPSWGAAFEVLVHTVADGW